MYILIITHTDQCEKKVVPVMFVEPTCAFENLHLLIFQPFGNNTASYEHKTDIITLYS